MIPQPPYAESELAMVLVTTAMPAGLTATSLLGWWDWQYKNLVL